ncbi:hypothetical protein SLA2020_182670 [Shorea laevis]
MAEPPERVYCMDDCWVLQGTQFLGSARNPAVGFRDPAAGFCRTQLLQIYRGEKKKKRAMDGCWVLQGTQLLGSARNPVAGFRDPAFGFCKTQLLGSATQLLGSADLQNPASADRSADLQR